MCVQVSKNTHYTRITTESSLLVAPNSTGTTRNPGASTCFMGEPQVLVLTHVLYRCWANGLPVATCTFRPKFFFAGGLGNFVHP